MGTVHTEVMVYQREVKVGVKEGTTFTDIRLAPAGRAETGWRRYPIPAPMSILQ
jgi:hypothetical protein